MTHRHTHAKKKSKSIIPGFGLSFGIVMAILGIISGDPPVLSGGILSQTVTIRILADHHQTESSVQLRSEVNTSHLEGRSHHGGGQHNFRTLCRVAHNQIHLPGQKDHINAHRSAAYHIPIIAGLIFVLTFGRQSFLYPYLEKLGIQIFSQITLPHTLGSAVRNCTVLRKGHG